MFIQEHVLGLEKEKEKWQEKAKEKELDIGK